MRLPLMSEEASTVMLIHPAPGANAIGAKVRHMPQRGLVRASRVVDAAH
jgi:hypothetical protein